MLATLLRMLARVEPGPPSLYHLPLAAVEAMFRGLSDVAFYVKDRELRFVAGNDTMREICGETPDTAFVGARSRDFFSNVTHRCHESADRAVLVSEAESAETLHLTVRLSGEAIWLRCRRWPWRDERSVRGVVCVGHLLNTPERQTLAHVRVATAIDHIESRLGENYKVSDLADLVGVSVSQLDRDFAALLGVPPRAYITKVRLETAAELLQTDSPIVEIAHACGYSDQSAFTRHFRRAMGQSPSQYRRSAAAASRARLRPARVTALFGAS